MTSAVASVTSAVTSTKQAGLESILLLVGVGDVGDGVVGGGIGDVGDGVVGGGVGDVGGGVGDVGGDVDKASRTRVHLASGRCR